MITELTEVQLDAIKHMFQDLTRFAVDVDIIWTFDDERQLWCRALGRPT